MAGAGARTMLVARPDLRDYAFRAGGQMSLLGIGWFDLSTQLAFEVAGGLQAAADVMAAVQLVTPAVSLGAVDTLLQHPAGLTHRALDPGIRRALGIGDGLLRLSVGLEDVDDLWRDLSAALDAAIVSSGALLAR